MYDMKPVSSLQGQQQNKNETKKVFLDSCHIVVTRNVILFLCKKKLVTFNIWEIGEAKKENDKIPFNIIALFYIQLFTSQ